ncbi:hypothetical protein F8271_28485 [Micromonospora sp. ALFpr18c]|uniref:hypothetical protein n=1 Tax=unclassified Micromonospora TaxID=2617518 RepID=UPI00124B587A|nr:hypothetical protein [Micromonospora sp. ALFpr18c]KAB1929850.1 hypothetical protein F8271_28485 [Micromonospora sp. ALFpr18c]
MYSNVLRNSGKGLMAFVLAAAGVAAVQFGTSAPAQAANRCVSGAWNALGDGEVLKTGSTGDTRYPGSLHGKTIRLYSNHANASVIAKAEGASSGDVISIDRSNFSVTGSAEHYFKSTTDIQKLGTWDYCETQASSSGTLTSKRIDGAHRYVRVCLRHSGALQCMNVWYGDNDDDAGDVTRQP